MMRSTTLFLAGILAMLAGPTWAQSATPKKPVSDPNRNAQWKPEKGKYYFSHALIYKYLNKVDGNEGELWVYIDPVTGTMCFQRETSFGTTDEMNDVILAFPNGQMIALGRGESGKKIRESFKNNSVTPVAEDVNFQRETFKKQCVPTGITRQEFGWQSAEHVLTYLKTSEQSRLWLAEVPFNMYPLYAFDEWDGDAQLPVSLSYAYLLSPRQLVTEADDAYMTLKLLSFEPKPYSVDLNQYAKQH